MSDCGQELCPNWTGDGRVCACVLLGIEPSEAEPTPEQIAALVAASPDIRPECIRQAGEQIDYLTAMSHSWIINGDERHGAMLQCLCLAFGFQQTEIERLRVENVNLRAAARAGVAAVPTEPSGETR